VEVRPKGVLEDQAELELLRMVDSPDVGVRYRAALRKDATERVLLRAIENEDRLVRRAAAGNPNAIEAVLLRWGVGRNTPGFSRGDVEPHCRPVLHVALVGNVLLDCRQWRTSHRSHKVAVGPKSRHPSFQRRKLLS
jgi:hypothetical protein